MRAYCLLAIQVVYGLSIRGTDDELNQADGQVIMDVNPSGAGGKGQQHFIKEEPTSMSRVAELPTDVSALHESLLSLGLADTAASLLAETKSKQVAQLHAQLVALGLGATAAALLEEATPGAKPAGASPDAKPAEVALYEPYMPADPWGQKMWARATWQNRRVCPCPGPPPIGFPVTLTMPIVSQCCGQQWNTRVTGKLGDGGDYEGVCCMMQDNREEALENPDVTRGCQIMDAGSCPNGHEDLNEDVWNMLLKETNEAVANDAK